MKLPKIFHTPVPAAISALLLTAAGVVLVSRFSPMLFRAAGEESNLLGDVNLDCKVTVSDAVMLARVVAEDTTCNVRLQGLANADVTNDGLLGADDTAVLLYMLAHERFNPDGTPVNARTVPRVTDTTAAVTETTAESVTVTSAESTADTASDTTVSPAKTKTIAETASAATSEATTAEQTTTVTAATTVTTAAPTTTTPEPTTTTTTTTTAKTTTSATTTTVTTTAKTTTTPAATTKAPSQTMTVDGRSYPLNAPLSAQTDSAAPTELLTLKYQKANITFAVYAEKPAELVIAIADDKAIVGYYAIGKKFKMPDEFFATDYIDKHPSGTGKTYAQLILREDSTVQFSAVADKSDLSVLAKLNFYAVNGVRGVNGVKPLQWSDAGMKSALAHSKDMAARNYFDHRSLDGTEFSDRLDQMGIDWRACGENIDCGYRDPFSALNGWYNSTAGHRDNMLSARFTYLGVGFAYGENSDYKYYGTQDFFTL